VGVLHSAIYVVLRGSARARLPFLVAAAVLGAYAGQAVGARLGDPLRIGDFGLLGSSLLAWVGIGVVAIMSTLGPSRDRPPGRPPGRG
jgi:hypothetical protein